MNRIPSIELLNATHQFPVVYTYKVIGKVELNFESHLQTVLTALPPTAAPTLSSRKTPDGRHLSITVEVCLESAEKVVELYERLLLTPGLVLLL